MIELLDVTQHYGVRPVLRGVSLRIERGEVVVILGPNGMGKTTLLGVMAGVLPLARGSVSIDGLRRRGSDHEELEIRKMTVFLPDQPWLPGNRTAREFLLAVGELYDVHVERSMEHVDQLLALFDLSSQADSPIRSLSSGQKKKVALCSALVTEAPILLLDEPFSGGLDPAGIITLKRIIQHRARRKDATIVLTSPVPELIEEIATRIVVLHDGEVLAYDTLEGLQRMTGHRGSLGDVLERLDLPRHDAQARRLLAGIFVMAGRRLKRFRQIAPTADRWVVCLAIFLLFEGPIIYFDWNRFPIAAHLPFRPGAFILVLAVVLHGVSRVVWFHPIWQNDYRAWLKRTPWTSRKPLPLGPIGLVWEDALVVGPLLLLCAILPAPSPVRLLCAFLISHLLVVTATLFMTATWAIGYSVAFGLGCAICSGQRPGCAWKPRRSFTCSPTSACGAGSTDFPGTPANPRPRPRRRRSYETLARRGLRVAI